jgi:phospholipid/cholesterol/gamma-HCH transport system permease protein
MTNECSIDFTTPVYDTLLVQFCGSWQIDQQRPGVEDVLKRLENGAELKKIIFDTKELASWDSSLLTFLNRIIKQCKQRDIRVEQDGLPHGVQQLLSLAAAVPKIKKTPGKLYPPRVFRSGRTGFLRGGGEFDEF